MVGARLLPTCEGMSEQCSGGKSLTACRSTGTAIRDQRYGHLPANLMTGGKCKKRPRSSLSHQLSPDANPFTRRASPAIELLPNARFWFSPEHYFVRLGPQSSPSRRVYLQNRRRI